MFHVLCLLHIQRVPVTKLVLATHRGVPSHETAIDACFLAGSFKDAVVGA